MKPKLTASLTSRLLGASEYPLSSSEEQVISEGQVRRQPYNWEISSLSDLLTTIEPDPSDPTKIKVEHKFKQKLEAFLEEKKLSKDSPSPIEITFKADNLTPEDESVSDALNSLGRLDLYGIQLPTGSTFTFKCSQNDKTIADKLTDSNTAGQFKLLSKEKLLELGQGASSIREITDDSATELTNKFKLKPGKDNKITASTDACKEQSIYVGTEISDETLGIIIDWLKEGDKRKCYVHNADCFSQASGMEGVLLHLGGEQEESCEDIGSYNVPTIQSVRRGCLVKNKISSVEDCEQISTEDLFDKMTAANNTILPYSNDHNPNAILLGAGKFAPIDKEYLVLDSPDNDPARIRSHLQDGHILYMTEKMLQKLEALGPIINGRKNIRLITVPKETKAEIEDKIRELNLTDYLSETVLLRLIYLKEQKQLSVEESIYWGLVNGLPTDKKNDILSQLQVGDKQPENLLQYTYYNGPPSIGGSDISSWTVDRLKNAGIGISEAGPYHYEKFEKGKTTPSDVSIFSSTQTVPLSTLLAAGGIFSLPKCDNEALNSLEDTEKNLIEQLTYTITEKVTELKGYLPNCFLIGSEQEKMIKAIAEDLVLIDQQNNKAGDSEEEIKVKNTRLFVGASGIGKDEILKKLFESKEFKEKYKLVLTKTINPHDIDQDLKAINEWAEGNPGKIGIINLQEFNLSEDTIESFLRIMLACYRHNNLYIVGTANDFTCREAIPDEWNNICKTTQLNGLSEQDIKDALDQFLNASKQDKKEEIYERIKSSQLQVNYRLLSNLCTQINSNIDIDIEATLKDYFGERKEKVKSKEEKEVKLEGIHQKKGSAAETYSGINSKVLGLKLESTDGMLSRNFFPDTDVDSSMTILGRYTCKGFKVSPKHETEQSYELRTPSLTQKYIEVKGAYNDFQLSNQLSCLPCVGSNDILTDIKLFDSDGNEIDNSKIEIKKVEGFSHVKF